jgi:hypothetical protein
MVKGVPMWDVVVMILIVGRRAATDAVRMESHEWEDCEEIVRPGLIHVRWM